MITRAGLVVMLAAFPVATLCQEVTSKDAVRPGRTGSRTTAIPTRDEAPQPDGPDLRTTLAFVKDKLTQQGPLTYTVAYADSADGSSWTNDNVYAITEVAPSSALCRLDFHHKRTVGGQVQFESDRSIPLGRITRVEALTLEADIREADAEAGHRSWTASVRPARGIVRMRLDDGKGVFFNIEDEELARRIARALTHAAKLCGGLEPEPF